MCRNRLPSILLLAFAAGSHAPAHGQEFRLRLDKPDHTFFFYQLNLAVGYDEARTDEGWGLADRSPRTQVSFEWLVKDESQMQRGWVPLASRSAWNAKFALEAQPVRGDSDDTQIGFRLLDTWLQIGTKWDRTSWFVGHRSIPFGHNPRIDSDLSFLPNQAGADLGFGTDTGAFFRTPLSRQLDLELAATAGGTLSGTPLVFRDEGGSWEANGDFKYRDTWLVTGRLGKPTFEPRELGIFVSGGRLHAASGPLTTITRVGIDSVVKRRETWELVNQIDAGENEREGSGRFGVYNLLNTFEWFVGPRLRVGATHTLRYEEKGLRPDDVTRGTVFGMVSVVIVREARFRINPFFEYLEEPGTEDAGVLFQICTGCGLKK